MIEVAFTRCTRPTLTARAISTYTVLGFTGYALASLASSALAVAWDLTLGERIIGLFVPPIAFFVTVTIASAIVGRERIVFYQTAFTGVLASAVVAARRRACRRLVRTPGVVHVVVPVDRPPVVALPRRSLRYDVFESNRRSLASVSVSSRSSSNGNNSLQISSRSRCDCRAKIPRMSPQSLSRPANAL